MKANTKIVQVFAELGTHDNFSDNKTDCLFVQWYSGLGTRDNLSDNGTDCLRQNIVHTVVCAMVCRAGHSRKSSRQQDRLF